MNVKIQPQSISVSAQQAELAVTTGEQIARDVEPIDPYTGSYTVTPSETAQVLETDGLKMTDDVTVEAVSDNYVGSGIARKSSADMSQLFDKVTAPSGYYESDGVLTLERAPTGTISIDKSQMANGYIEATVHQQHGYVLDYSGTATTMINTSLGREITPTEETQTFRTKNTFITGNIVVNPIPSQYIIPSGELSITANGTADVTQYASANVNVKPTLKYGVMRNDAELVKTYSFDKMAVADLELTIPAYTTTATTIKASEALGETYTVDFENYNYYILERMLAIPTYSVSTKGKGRAEYHANSALYELTEIPANSFQAIIDNTKMTNRTYGIVASGTFYRLIYWSNGTTIAGQSTQAYGMYQAVVAPTIASGGVITMNTPTFGARGHTTYFTSTYMNAVTDVRLQYVFEIYRSPKNNLNLDGWGVFQNMNHVIDCVNSQTHKLT